MLMTKFLAYGLGLLMAWAMNRAPENPRQRLAILVAGAPVVALLASI